MTAEKNLEKLRGQIDHIDRSIHDLIMQRSEVVSEVKKTKQEVDGPIFWPAREAEVLRKLLERHTGDLPHGALVRIWRELISAFLIIQGEFKIAVLDNEDGSYWDIARDHFGSQTPMTRRKTARGVLRVVAEGETTAGILPLPQIEENEPWWPLLGSQGNGKSLRICAKLPFISGGNRRGGDVEALLIANLSPLETGDDKSYIIIELDELISRSRLTSTLSSAGLSPLGIVQLTNNTNLSEIFLIEVNGFVNVNDKRLASILESGTGFMTAQPIGSYAVPFRVEK